MPVDETIAPSLGKESLEENLCILEVSKIRAGAERERCKLSYLFPLKKSFVVNLHKKH